MSSIYMSVLIDNTKRGEMMVSTMSLVRQLVIPEEDRPRTLHRPSGPENIAGTDCRISYGHRKGAEALALVLMMVWSDVADTTLISETTSIERDTRTGRFLPGQ
jgi:hypothetical protein